jgi:hypothetical protein
MITVTAFSVAAYRFPSLIRRGFGFYLCLSYELYPDNFFGRWATEHFILAVM